MTLVEVIAALAAFPEEHTIYAVLPWTASSEAIVVDEDDAELRSDAGRLRVGNYEYFIEISIARQLLDGLVSGATSAISLEDRCLRLIEYAVNDA